MMKCVHLQYFRVDRKFKKQAWMKNSFVHRVYNPPIIGGIYVIQQQEYL